MPGGDDEINRNELMTPVEILSLTTLGIIELLRRQQVCFYSGPAVPPRASDITSFVECLPYLGKSTALIFCAPHLRKVDVLAMIHDAAFVDNSIKLELAECVGIDHGFEMVWRDELLFHFDQPNTLIISPDRLWGHFCVLQLWGRPMKLFLLHLGVTGEEAEKTFLEPHRIRATVVISNPAQ